MNFFRTAIPALLLASTALLAVEVCGAEPWVLRSPLDYQVSQRQTATSGTIEIAGALPPAVTAPVQIEAKLGTGGAIPWQRVARVLEGQTEFRGKLGALVGGWYRLEVRALRGETTAAEAVVEHVGVGEVFVIAGQSNSANHGEERQTATSGMVSAFTGTKWQLANDPQPGASGSGGSFLPPFGDALAARWKVPIGIVSTGVGATSVREWLPRGARFPWPPTITNRVTELPTGGWEAKGDLFERFVARLKQLGPHGFRAVLWHQGESDAHQQDSTRTLPGELYQKYLAELIRSSCREAGWDAPWFVAQASYHTPDDPGSPEIRAAQQAVAASGLALAGPDTDALGPDWREAGGKGVHFSGPGLRKHATLWVEKVAPWLDQVVRAAPAENH